MKKFSLATLSVYLGIVGIIAGGIYFLDDHYALASDHTKLEKRVNLNELQYLKQEALKQKYFFKDQTRKYPSRLTINKEF